MFGGVVWGGCLEGCLFGGVCLGCLFGGWAVWKMGGLGGNGLGKGGLDKGGGGVWEGRWVKRRNGLKMGVCSGKSEKNMSG